MQEFPAPPYYGAAYQSVSDDYILFLEYNNPSEGIE
jgi:hypothetical protein